jgi:hypothetical protein
LQYLLITCLLAVHGYGSPLPESRPSFVDAMRSLMLECAQVLPNLRSRARIIPLSYDSEGLFPETVEISVKGHLRRVVNLFHCKALILSNPPMGHGLVARRPAGNVRDESATPFTPPSPPTNTIIVNGDSDIRDQCIAWKTLSSVFAISLALVSIVLGCVCYTTRRTNTSRWEGSRWDARWTALSGSAQRSSPGEFRTSTPRRECRERGCNNIDKNDTGTVELNISDIFRPIANNNG